MSPPATRPSRAGAANFLTSSHASGAPSEPCLGAPVRVVSVDRMVPIGRSRAGSARWLGDRLVVLNTGSFHDAAFLGCGNRTPAVPSQRPGNNHQGCQAE